MFSPYIRHLAGSVNQQINKSRRCHDSSATNSKNPKLFLCWGSKEKRNKTEFTKNQRKTNSLSPFHVATTLNDPDGHLRELNKKIFDVNASRLHWYCRSRVV